MITQQKKQTHCRKILRKNLEALLKVPEPMRLWEWAEKRRTMPKGITAKPGPYRVAVTPYATEPQESFFAPGVQTTVMCWASRTGKTETELNLTGYTIDHDPCNMLWVYPTIDTGKKWRKEFFNPMIKASRCFRGKVRKVGAKDADNTLLSVGFPGGRVSVIGANSPSGFRQIQAPRVICEEVDAMENSEEGDPVELAFKRADNYADSIQIVSSTPTTKGHSRVWAWMLRSDFRKWFCPCQHCGHRQVWMWANMRFDKERPEGARIVCEKCGGEHDDAQWAASVRAGEWRATQPFNGIRGYWLNGLNSLFPPKKGFTSKLHQFVAEFLGANESGREAIQTWTNTFLAETWAENEEETIQPKAVLERCERYTPDALPVGALLVAAGADIQKNRIEVEAAAFGDGEERWAIEKAVIWGDTEKDDSVWAKLDAFLLREFTRTDGVKLKIERAFIDTKYKGDRVLGFCAKRIARGVYPCFGQGTVGRIKPPLLPPKPSRNNKSKIPHWAVGTDAAKTLIYDRLPIPPLPNGEPSPRAFHFPVGFGYDEAHFNQLTSEVRVIRYHNGVPYSMFTKRNNDVRNESLDIAVYSLAAMRSLYPINWPKLAANRLAQHAEDTKGGEDTPAPEQPQPVHPALQNTPQPQARPMRMAPRQSSWVHGGAW